MALSSMVVQSNLESGVNKTKAVLNTCSTVLQSQEVIATLYKAQCIPSCACVCISTEACAFILSMHGLPSSDNCATILK